MIGRQLKSYEWELLPLMVLNMFVPFSNCFPIHVVNFFGGVHDLVQHLGYAWEGVEKRHPC